MEKQFDLLLSNGHQDSMDLDTAAGRFDSILRDNDSAKKGLLNSLSFDKERFLPIVA